MQILKSCFLTIMISWTATAEPLPTLQSIQNSNSAPVKIQPTGQRESLEPRVNGVIHGKGRYYHPNGQLYAVIEYNQGKKVGVHTLHRENGTKEQIISYKDGVLDGTVVWFDDKGEPNLEVVYNKGKPGPRKYLQVTTAPTRVHTDPNSLSAKIDAAFKPEKTTEELIAIALQETNSDNVAENIKARAYDLLDFVMQVPKRAEIIKKSRDHFIADFKKTESKFVKGKSAELILRLDPPQEERPELVFAFLSERNLPVDLKDLKKDEEKYAELLNSLKTPKDLSSAAHQLLKLIKRDFNYSARLITTCLRLLEKWGPSLDQNTIDEVIEAKFEYLDNLRRHAERSAKNKNEITIVRFATDNEVVETTEAFDKTICSRPLRPKSKVWQYDFMTLPEEMKAVNPRIVCRRS